MTLIRALVQGVEEMRLRYPGAPIRFRLGFHTFWTIATDVAPRVAAWSLKDLSPGFQRLFEESLAKRDEFLAQMFHQWAVRAEDLTLFGHPVVCDPDLKEWRVEAAGREGTWNYLDASYFEVSA